eukprot:CAMPEP_0115494738 /NCGR_PEP_ID=MMETSP0271-20121206/64879_1 /TAXON_ID=71861 /ORGANISM="Scrippsiella trochoidea, Strain CCMP3099" /LENGTH=40 /DNA_ID= /DNA_START= /DNA_END= /DNA_ORIENTATION=
MTVVYATSSSSFFFGALCPRGPPIVAPMPAAPGCIAPGAN